MSRETSRETEKDRRIKIKKEVLKEKDGFIEGEILKVLINLDRLDRRKRSYACWWAQLF
jgi:hypothetical protein